MIQWRLLVFSAWTNYLWHHALKTVAEYALGFVIVGGTVVPAAVVVPRVMAPDHTPAKVVVHEAAAPSKKPVKSTPQPAPSPAPAVTTPVVSTPQTTPAPQQSAPQPFTPSQPSPGSGAKTLASAPPSTSSPSSPSSPSTPSGTSGSTAPPATGGYTSTNWAGYVATAGGYTVVSATWEVPAVTGNGSTDTADASWIGIGGIFSSDLIQTGTENTVSADGQVQTAAFYETLPDPALLIPSLNVNTGDSMSATITETATNAWQISITDNTTTRTYTVALSYASTNSSAEWIEEDPSYENGSLVPFDDFGTVTFTNGAATAGGVSGTLAGNNAQPITMVDTSGQPVATPSVLTDSGTGFSVTRSQ